MVAKGLVSIIVYIYHYTKLVRNNKHKVEQGNNIHLRQLSSSQPAVSPVEQVTTPHVIALLVGFAMTARGEIGFLIASLSQSSGTLTLRHKNRSAEQPPGGEVFLVIVWAVIICTIVGPVGVGIVVRWIKVHDRAYPDWI